MVCFCDFIVVYANVEFWFLFFLLINIYSVLEKLIESLFPLIQLSIFINSLLISDSNCFALFPDIVRLASSANKLTLNLVAEGRTFMYKRNSVQKK